MELLEGIMTRRSIRAFKSTPIPEETIRSILEAAKKSPSYTNTQPWEVTVVTGKKRDELSKILLDLAASGAASSPDMTLPEKWPPELEKRSREHHTKRATFLGLDTGGGLQGQKSWTMNLGFYGAPCVIFLFMDSTLGSWSVFDMGIFAQSLILAAHSFGVGSCLQAMTTRYPDAVRDFLGIPATKKLVIGISMGYPDPEDRANAYQSDRINLEDFVKWYS